MKTNLYETDRIKAARARIDHAKRELAKREEAHRTAALAIRDFSPKIESEGPAGPPSPRTP